MAKRFGYSDSWQAFGAAMDSGIAPRILLYGPRGTGKSTIAQNYGDGGRYAITLTEETPAAEIRGHFLRKGDSTEWHDGVGTRAMREGKGLVINEIDYASPDVLAYLMVLLDDASVSRLTLPTGETVKPADGFHVIATMNGQPKDLPQPVADRLPVKLEIREPNPEGIRALPDDLQTAARESVKTPEDEDRYISLRGWHTFAMYREALGTEGAAHLLFGDRGEDILLSMKIADPEKAKATAEGEKVPLKRGRISYADNYEIRRLARTGEYTLAEIAAKVRRSEVGCMAIIREWGLLEYLRDS